MPGPISNEGGNGAPDSTTPAGDVNNANIDPKGTEPAKTEVKGNDAQLDFSSMDDDAFGKVFEDQRLWNHPRFKELNDSAKKGKEALDKLNQMEEEALVKEQKFEELANKRGDELAAMKNRLERQLMDNEIIKLSSKEGAVDTDAVLALIDRSNIRITDTNGTSGVEEALGKLKATKSYLFGGSKLMVGSETNPANPSVPKFKASQINDPVFFKEHEKEIMEQLKIPGGIENDLPAVGF